MVADGDLARGPATWERPRATLTSLASRMSRPMSPDPAVRRSRVVMVEPAPARLTKNDR
ncbi:hypothetical protein [Streptomyces avidinii]|uniref:Uncharacterized protein n=1 Tax=Streptomyces avidinii TaxID=1895 RepID=A0ABS4L0M2_STRAV|nr:hypothetical protein [Streptomyces avidinii]MBP2034674.1 hypothetical protein [Streptomyces avidinii]